MTIDGAIQIEIGGVSPGPGPEDPPTDDAYDQINVTGTGNVSLLPGSKLEIDLINNFQPAVGQIFDILTYDGTLSGTFDTASGMYGFGDGSLYFEIVDDPDAKVVQLEVKDAPSAGKLISRTPAINDVLGQYYSDYFTLDGSVTLSGELAIGDFVTLAGSFEFGVNLLQDVTVATGLSPNLEETPTGEAIHAQIDLLTAIYPGLSLSDDLQTLSGVPVTTLEIGGSDIRAFAGTNGPYWADLDHDGAIGWAFNTGNGDDASRTINSVTGTSGYTVGQVLDPNTVVTLAAGVTLTVGQVALVDETGQPILDAGGNQTMSDGMTFGDVHNIGKVDADETAELSQNATGLAITDVDFGYVAMLALPVLPLSSQFFHALKLTSSQVGLVGIEQVELEAQNVLVEVNTGPTWTALGVRGDGPAVVDFAASFPSDGVGPAGYEVRTGTTSEPIYIDHDGNERLGASVDDALLSIGDNEGKFVYLHGNLSFEKGPTANVT
ncbi:MAG: hypothetical protein JXB62_11055, partial [Pirellulales bacterium]|nr:hypothetical protein [Pirellulales bacterium]